MADAKIKVDGDLGPVIQAFKSLETAVEGVSKALAGKTGILEKDTAASKENKDKTEALTGPAHKRISFLRHCEPRRGEAIQSSRLRRLFWDSGSPRPYGARDDDIFRI